MVGLLADCLVGWCIDVVVPVPVVVVLLLLLLIAAIVGVVEVFSFV